MKHPALARVFAVVVAILGLLLLLSGVRGIGKTEDEYRDRLAYEKKFSDRIENYRTLRAELLNSADYRETMDALERFLTEHEKAAARHKTDTALYSAKKGGLKMGEDIIVSTREQMNELRAQLRGAESRRALLESLIAGLIASQKSNLPWLTALTNQAAQYAVDSYTQSVNIALVSGELRVLMENEPTPASVAAAHFAPPEPPAVPEMPVFEMSGADAGLMQAAYGAAADSYLSAADAYEQAAAAYAAQLQENYDASARQMADRLNSAYGGAADAVVDAAGNAEYQLAHRLWEEECRRVKAQLDLTGPCAQITRLSAALTSLVRQANTIYAAVMGETGGIYPALDELTALGNSLSARLDRLAGTDVSQLSNEEFLQLTDDLQEYFDLLTDALIVVGSNLDNPAPLIAELLDRLSVTEALADVLDGMLEKADRQLQAALEELWYQMGEAEKDVIRLEAEKLGLDKEAALLSKRTLDADALRDLRARHATARQLLLNVPEVKESGADEAALADSARVWLDGYARETGRLREGRLFVNALAIFGGAMGILGIPAAYELIRSRFLLLAPVLLCLVCAAGAEALNVALGLGQQYVALFTAILALVQLLIVLPRAKKPRRAPRHLKV